MMVDIDQIIEELWEKIQFSFTQLAEEIVTFDESVEITIGRNQNDYFLLRTYLSFMKCKKTGNEIAVSIDVIKMSNKLKIISDICWDSGSIIAEMPDVYLNLLDDKGTLKHKINKWFVELETFYNVSQIIVKKEISNLVFEEVN